MKPWLSVIMPVHLGEAWIEASLQSIADEADSGIEVIVLDSSPNNATASLVRRFESRLDLTLFPESPLQSWQAKTNEGVRVAQAEHLCMLHQDDLWLRGRAAAVRRWIARAPDASLHLAATTVVDRRGHTLGLWRCPFREEALLDPTDLLERLLVQNFVSTPAPVFRRDSWLACGGFDEKLWYSCDWDIWLKLGEIGSVWHHMDVTTAFRVHGNSLTVTGSRDGEDFGEQLRVVFNRHVARLAHDRTHVRAVGLASIEVNRALASLAAGKWGGILPALGSVAALGAPGINRYLRDSRIVDRVLPRLRARLRGTF